MDPRRVSHYELGPRLGRGGMGEVYEAFDLKARRKVALKFIAPELAQDPESIRRFESEAVNAAQMHHPYIATLFEFDPDAEPPFIAMELVPGATLRERIAPGPLPVTAALAIARDVASALAYAHRRQIVHRDIKPENLMFDEEGRVKVMDFGLARALLTSRLTATGSVLGTACYMSPESLAGTSGPATDVFALGLVLHEMLTGRQVFSGDNPLSVMFMIANQEPPSLRQQRPEVGEEVEILAQRMLARDPEQRIDAASAAEELARLTGGSSHKDMGLAAGAGPSRRGRTSDPETAATVAMPLAPATASLPAPSRGVLRRIGIPAGALVIVLAALAMVRWRPGAGAVSAEAHQRAVLLSNQAYEALGRDDLAAARRLAAAALAEDPDYGEARLNLGAIYVARYQPDSASMVYSRLVSTHARDPHVLSMAHYGLGNINLDSGAYDRAVEHFRSCFQLDSSRKEAFNGLGLALILAGRAPDALAVLERGLARFPSEAVLNKNAALASWKLQEADATLRYATRALGIAPGYGAALGLSARARARLGDRDGALRDWRAFAAADPAASERAEVEADLVAAGMPAAALGTRPPPGP